MANIRREYSLFLENTRSFVQFVCWFHVATLDVGALKTWKIDWINVLGSILGLSFLKSHIVFEPQKKGKVGRETSFLLQA